jgi:uncharacterized repeat protein (TIGR01451 family)
MNFYGPASLPNGTPVPTGTLVLAVDPQNVICGATVVWEPGQYGLLACYGDDPDTDDIDEGGVPGDTIRLFIAGGTLIGTGTWTAHGGRQLVAVDLGIIKQVQPEAALPGETITYTLRYRNAGNAVANGVVLTDVVPVEITVSGIDFWGAPITQTMGGGTLGWQVADLAPGAGGIITVTGVVSPALAAPLAITNTAIIAAPLEARPENNVAQAVLHVILGLASIWPRVMHGAL